MIAKSYSAYQRITTTYAGLLEVHNRREVKSREDSNSVDEDLPLESDDVSLELEDTSSESDNGSSESEDASWDSESSPLEFPGEAIDMEILDLHHEVSVDFIHRTARDFMRDSTQGGTFLKANTPSDCHPLVSHVKVLLARIRLFRAFGDLYEVDELMRETLLAERVTGVAQTRLCELIDDVMSRIDRKCGTWPTDSHWSVRWGGPEWPSLHKDLSSLDSKKEISPLSSNDSFHSVNSQPDTPDDLRMALVKKPDFLAYAVYHGLHRYGQQVLHDRKAHLEPDTASYLLYCAVLSLNRPYPLKREELTGSLNLIDEFLKQGGNPNLKDPMKDPNLTIWSTFLVGMHKHLDFFWPDYGLNESLNEAQRRYMQTTVAFVEKGAGLRSICTVPSSPIGSEARHYSVYLDLSALLIIELSLRDQPELSHLRTLCATKGAPDYSRCTRVDVFQRTGEGSMMWESPRKLMVSDRESTAVLEIYKTGFASGSGRETLYQMVTCLVKLTQDRLEGEN